MDEKKALVTLVIGDKYQANFNRYCRTTWEAYASRHGFELVVLDRPLDESDRAQSRSPAWQKLLILSDQRLAGHDRVVWVDSDIMINPMSPDICATVPKEKIGATDEYGTPNKVDHADYLRRTYQRWDHQGVRYVANPQAADFHADYGLPREFDAVVQTGVMVASPRYHRELFEHVYHSYEDKGEACFNYEMRPLSYEIQKADCISWLSPKFNLLWMLWRNFHYPFLNPPQKRWQRKISKVMGQLRLGNRAAQFRKCATNTYLNSYFLHFAGSAREMRYVDTNVRTPLEL